MTKVYTQKSNAVRAAKKAAAAQQAEGFTTHAADGGWTFKLQFPEPAPAEQLTEKEQQIVADYNEAMGAAPYATWQEEFDEVMNSYMAANSKCKSLRLTAKELGWARAPFVACAVRYAGAKVPQQTASANYAMVKRGEL